MPLFTVEFSDCCRTEDARKVGSAGQRIYKPARVLLFSFFAAVIHFILFVACVHLDPEPASIAERRAYWPREGVSFIGNKIITRDAGAYLEISENGYQPSHWFSAFYPLWPLLIQPIVIHGQPKWVPWCVLGIANILTIAGSCLLFAYTSRAFSVPTAWATLIIQNCLPGGLFFYLPFTESLTFFLISLLFWSLQRHLFLVGSVACLLLPLARPVGILLFPAIIWWWWRDKDSRTVAPICAMTIGYASYFACMNYFTGNPFEGFEAQLLHANQPSLAYFATPLKVLRSFFDVNSFLDPVQGLIDRLCFLFALLLLAIAWKLDRFLFMAMFPMAIIPAVTNLFLSYRRFEALMVPGTIALAYWSGRGHRQRKIVSWLCGAGLVAQVVLLWEHTHGGWAG